MLKATTTLMTIGVMSLSLLNQMVHAGYSWGWCPEMNTKPAFDLNQYIGVWYEQKHDKTLLFEYGECIQAGYSKGNDGLVNVHNTMLNGFSNTIDGVKGTAECNGSKCKVGFFLFRNGDYQVIDTDYTNYAVVYGCTNYFFLFKFEQVWAMTRTATPSGSVVSSYEQVIRDKIPQYGFDNFHNT